MNRSNLLRLTDMEISFYTYLFDLGDNSKSGVLQPSVVQKLLGLSKLPSSILAQIWNISAQKKKVLQKDDFFVACRCVALAQSGIVVNAENLMSNLDVVLPTFEGVKLPVPTTVLKSSPVSSPKKSLEEKRGSEITQLEMELMNAAPNGLPLIPTSVNMSNIVKLQEPIRSTMPSIAEALPQSDPEVVETDQDQGFTYTDEEWVISDREMEKYSEIFLEADLDGDSFVSGPEAKVFFEKSGLSNTQLHSVWLLADFDRTNRLSFRKFAIAMHVIMRIRLYKAAIPTYIPPSIIAFAQEEEARFEEPDVESLQNERNKLVADTNAAKERAEIYQARSSKMKQLNDELVGDITEWRQQLQEMEELIQRTNNELQEFSAHERELQNQLSELRSINQLRVKTLTDLQRTRDNTAKSVLDLQKESEDTAKSTSEMDLMISQLTLENEQSQARLDTITEVKSTQLNIVDSRKANVTRLMEQKATINDQTNQVNKELAQLKASSNILKEENTALTAELAQLQSQLDDIRELVALDKTALNKQKSLNSGVSDAKNKVKAEISSLTKKDSTPLKAVHGRSNSNVSKSDAWAAEDPFASGEADAWSAETETPWSSEPVSAFEENPFDESKNAFDSDFTFEDKPPAGKPITAGKSIAAPMSNSGNKPSVAPLSNSKSLTSSVSQSKSSVKPAADKSFTKVPSKDIKTKEPEAEWPTETPGGDDWAF